MNIRLFSYIYLFILGLSIFNPLMAENLVVGTTSAYAPYVSLDDKCEYVGFDIDFAQALSQKLNKNLVIKDLGSMPALMLALKQNKIDAIIWAISITEERQKQMEMIYYQGEKVTSMPLLFWKKIPEGIASIKNMENNPKITICVEAGSFQENFLSKISGLKLKQVDKVMDAILEIKYGKSTATMIDPSLLATVLKQFPNLAIMDIPLPFNEQSFGNGICLTKQNKALIAEIRQAVKELQNEGKILELEKKWNLGGQ